MQISQSLSINSGKISCNKCEAVLGDSGQNWKTKANLEESKPLELGPPYTTDERLLLRKFCCPGCGVLLDSELAMPGDPFLEDIVYGSG